MAVPLHGRILLSGYQETEDENTGLAYRKLPGKVGKRFFSDGKAKPRGVSEKIILAGGCGIFPESLALPEAFAVRPL